MSQSNKPRKPAMILAAGVAAASLTAAAAVPAHAAAPSRSEVTDIQTIDSYCGFTGLTVRRTIHIDILDFVHTSAGSDVGHFLWKFTSVRENVANGKTLTTIGLNVGGDHRVVDNGDGTYTVYSDVTDSDRAYDGNGRMVGITAVHAEWGAVYDSNTDTWSDAFYIHENGRDTEGDLCAPGGLVEQYLI